jgi:NAD(P)-dependent dehydrogenase (short-subunit alcohol dehydrogenase family)
MGSLAGKVAVVFGASRGIGKGIAVELGLAGAHVVVAGRTARAGSSSSPGSLEETVAQIKDSGGQASAVTCDATDAPSVSTVFQSVRADQARLDVLVNSVFDTPRFAQTIGIPFWELPMDAWDQVIGLGTRTAYLATVAATPLLMQSGGLIINVSGRGAERYRYNVVYGVGKAALDRMTRDMADELRAHQVTVVSLWPNVTRTENLERNANRARTSYGDLDLLETPRYVGRAVTALAGDPAILDRSGRRFWVAELGAHYGFTDENGREHPLPE